MALLAAELGVTTPAGNVRLADTLRKTRPTLLVSC